MRLFNRWRVVRRSGVRSNRIRRNPRKRGLRASGEQAGIISTPSWRIARPNCVRRTRPTPATRFRGHKLRGGRLRCGSIPPQRRSLPAPAMLAPPRRLRHQPGTLKGPLHPRVAAPPLVLVPVEAVEVLHVSFHFFCGSQSTGRTMYRGKCDRFGRSEVFVSRSKRHTPHASNTARTRAIRVSFRTRQMGRM